MKISDITHPDYDALISAWEKFRLTYEGGEDFISAYTKMFSAREDDTDYQERIDITYCPAHAKAAIMDIKNAIFQRMIDVKRNGGSTIYQKACAGEEGGVDRNGSSMTAFVGQFMLPELLALGTVGVYVDNTRAENVVSKYDAKALKPYMYIYKAEEIRSWSYDANNELQALLLQDTVDDIDEETMLVTGSVTQFRYLLRTESGVSVRTYDEDGEPLEAYELDIPVIPFVFLSIGDSLLKDIADHQVALLNLASSDMNFATKANFPFYTEQFDPRAEAAYLKTENAYSEEVRVGVTKGRRYPKDLEAPSFIHPSPEPLRASMDKQEAVKQEIRQLVALALTNIDPKRASAESKQQDKEGLEAGLSYIGLELQNGENRLAYIWSVYEGGTPAVVRYPTNYTLKTDADRMAEAKDITDLIPKIPSLDYQKALAKRVVEITVGNRVDSDTLETMFNQIDVATVISIDPEVIRNDLEAGLVSTETASQARGYPKGEVEQAKKDHAERAARIALAQSKASARGVADMDTNTESGSEERAEANDTTLNTSTEDQTRGEGK